MEQSKRYNSHETEAKWQQRWETNACLHADASRPTYYVPEMFPYLGTYPYGARANYAGRAVTAGTRPQCHTPCRCLWSSAENARGTRRSPQEWTYHNIDAMRMMKPRFVY